MIKHTNCWGNVAAIAKGYAGWFLTACEDRIDCVHVMLIIVSDIRGQNRIAQHVDVIQPVNQSRKVINIA